MTKSGQVESENGTRPHTEDLETFLAVVDEGGFGAAARALGVPKSTISRRMQRLETTLGVRLLARTRQVVRPTDAGARVVERVRDTLGDLDALTAAARGGRDTPRGRLKVSAPTDLAAHRALWLGFMQAYPQVALQVSFTNRYVDVVREGFDAAIRGGTGDDEALVARRIGAYRLRAVASPGWAATHAPLAVPADLRARDCVLLQPFRGGARPPAGVRHLVVDQLHVAHDACLHGLGVAILPDTLVNADVDAGRLTSVLAAYDPLTVPVYAAYPDRRFLPASLIALLDHLQAGLSDGG